MDPIKYMRASNHAMLRWEEKMGNERDALGRKTRGMVGIAADGKKHRRNPFEGMEEVQGMNM